MDVGGSSVSKIPVISTYSPRSIKEPDNQLTKIGRVVARIFTEISRTLDLASRIRIFHFKHIFSDPLQEIEYKYTRTGIDKDVLDTGGSNSRVQYHVLDRMTNKIDLSNQPEEVQSKVRKFRTCFERSEKFFNEVAEMKTQVLLHPNITISSIATSLKNEFVLLNGGESFIFPAGTSDHAVVYRATKTENGMLHLRLYNTGGGAEADVDENFNTRVCMPLFEIDPSKTDVHDVFNQILQLKRGKHSEYNAEVEKIITTQLLPAGIRVDEGDKKNLHNPQDRGNCSWKSLSTCFSDLVKDIQVVLDEETLKKLPPDVAKELRGQKIEYKRLVKMVDYEVLRDRIDRINQSGLGCIRARIKTESFSDRQLKKLAFKELEHAKGLLIKYRIKGSPKDFQFPKELTNIFDDQQKLDELKKYIELTTENTDIKSGIIQDLDSLICAYHNRDISNQ